MRKRLLRIVFAATTGMAATYTALAPATAASAATDSRADSTASVIVPMSWYYWDTYPNKRECQDVGEELIRKGWASNYSCVYKRGEYELHYTPA